jgi:hypothetical protein
MLKILDQPRGDDAFVRFSHTLLVVGQAVEEVIVPDDTRKVSSVKRILVADAESCKFILPGTLPLL